MKYFNTLKEVFISSLPLAAVIIIVCGFVAPMENAYDYVKLAVGYLGVVVGQAMFLNGLDISILPIGKLVGSSLIRLKKALFIIIVGFLFGLLATVAEPALWVLAKQTHMIMAGVNEMVFVWVLSTGIGLFVGFSLFRILKDLNIKIVFAVFYIVIFIVVIFVPEQFIALAFDGSGATTGDVSVPFILALGLGISATMSKSKTNEDTFGIIGLASVGPILAVFIYGIVLKGVYGGVIPPAGLYNPGAVEHLGEIILDNMGGVALALFPIVIVFLPFQLFLIKLSKREFIKILLGTLVVYVGLLIFLSGIDFGFAFAGKYIGEVFLDAARPGWFKWLLLLVGFVLGAAITLSEPAVTVLGEQLEEITNGHITKMSIRITLAIGIGFAALICMVKILTQINILWFLIPLYAIALIMLRFSSRLFVGLAFDSGGVTGGALTSAFLTPLTLGTAQAVAGSAGPGAQSVLINGFGIIAFISVTPLIAVQALGIIYDIRLSKTRKLITEAEAAELEELAALAAQAGKTETRDVQKKETNEESFIMEVKDRHE
ncbi:hypothetical protein HMPREF0322_00807 [Desulfitobacterium hafniense DP7]|uniref:DUF1538 domain-containing protein n=1 Tax=Desulfitobacterium hafniense DP7 TaxID=537010 RepID=G9XIN1_DESHA|nr:DUF1538 domain-containing protein [Desulfitobacterium hafniense]EHL08495.1 hypothetical protein HMPREF0322_00807 [Desulfitobacterium hafniense DP7]